MPVLQAQDTDSVHQIWMVMASQIIWTLTVIMMACLTFSKLGELMPTMMEWWIPIPIPTETASMIHMTEILETTILLKTAQMRCSEQEAMPITMAVVIPILTKMLTGMRSRIHMTSIATVTALPTSQRQILRIPIMMVRRMAY